ncbi:MAG: hypothetical protein WC717_03415 [Candidatus Micrarchaeia archaeon]|jgi:hypothetical protein
MRFAVLLFFVMIALPVLHPASGVSALRSALNELCVGLSSLLPVAAMLMTLLAAVIYAVGQMMGAETRARANVWATAALTGAMMAVLITVVAPSILGAVYGGTITCSGGGGGGGPPTCPAGQTWCAAESKCKSTSLPCGGGGTT